MGRIILSCGHEIGPSGNQYSVNIKDLSFDGRPIIKYMTICEECLINARINDDILDSQEEINNYLTT